MAAFFTLEGKVDSRGGARGSGRHGLVRLNPGAEFSQSAQGPKKHLARGKDQLHEPADVAGQSLIGSGATDHLQPAR